jgi:hypothetical protein
LKPPGRIKEIITMKRRLLLLFSAALGVASAEANDNPFGCSGDACAAKHGEFELQQSVAMRRGLDLGTGFDAGYRGYDLATQLEIGLSEISHVDLILSSGVLRSADFRGSFIEGFAVEYKRLIGVAAPDQWNAAWAGAFGYSRVDAASGEERTETSYVGRLFLQRDFGTRSQWVYVTNLSTGLVHDAEGTCGVLEWSQGLAYRADDHWSFGVEAVAEGCWTRFRTLANSSLCVGPCVSYRMTDFSIVCTHLWQVSGSPSTDDGRNLRDTSRSETRLLVARGF